jgi:hypothetical protein
VSREEGVGGGVIDEDMKGFSSQLCELGAHDWRGFLPDETTALQQR